jgi:hypothetical protein
MVNYNIARAVVVLGPSYQKKHLAANSQRKITNLSQITAWFKSLQDTSAKIMAQVL